MDYSISHQEHSKELNALPKPYPIQEAIKNNDIVVSPVDPHNTARFYEFLSNVEKGIPDKIRIIRYGFDNPLLAVKTILEYNGTFFIFTVSSDIVYPESYYGNEIIYRYNEPGGPWQYLIKKFNRDKELVFSLYD